MLSTDITEQQLFDTLKDIKLSGSTCLYTREKCAELAPLINEINQLKAEKNAVILAHSYVNPEIIHGVADYVGDSYELSKRAKETDADTIVFVAVKFMAETAKLLNPSKTVLIPSETNGCSLADSITGPEVAALREQYPDYTFVCYINTTADVKAQCDVCVTSSNVGHIVASLPNDKIYFLPDRLMGQNLINELRSKGIEKDIKYSDGTCYVHEEYDPEMIQYVRLQFPEAQVLSHPECAPNIIEKSDFVGSTTQMVNHVKESPHTQFFMLTECGLSTRLQMELPGKQFVGSCTMCKYMKSNSLADIARVLNAPNPQDIVHIDPADQAPAVACINAMFDYAG